MKVKIIQPVEKIMKVAENDRIINNKIAFINST
jgi:hypothetical protein